MNQRPHRSKISQKLVIVGISLSSLGILSRFMREPSVHDLELANDRSKLLQAKSVAAEPPLVLSPPQVAAKEPSPTSSNDKPVSRHEVSDQAGLQQVQGELDAYHSQLSNQLGMVIPTVTIGDQGQDLPVERFSSEVLKASRLARQKPTLRQPEAPVVTSERDVH